MHRSRQTEEAGHTWILRSTVHALLKDAKMLSKELEIFFLRLFSGDETSLNRSDIVDGSVSVREAGEAAGVDEVVEEGATASNSIDSTAKFRFLSPLDATAKFTCRIYGIGA